jgi:hypothetical protein
MSHWTSLTFLTWPFLAIAKIFVRICFNAALGDDVPPEFTSGDSEGAFLQIQPDVKAPEVCDGFL